VDNRSRIGWDCPWNAVRVNKDATTALFRAFNNGLFIEGIGVGFFKVYYGYRNTGSYVFLKHAINTTLTSSTI